MKKKFLSKEDVDALLANACADSASTLSGPFYTDADDVNSLIQNKDAKFIAQGLVSSIVWSPKTSSESDFPTVTLFPLNDEIVTASSELDRFLNEIFSKVVD